MYPSIPSIHSPTHPPTRLLTHPPHHPFPLIPFFFPSFYPLRFPRDHPISCPPIHTSFPQLTVAFPSTHSTSHAGIHLSVRLTSPHTVLSWHCLPPAFLSPHCGMEPSSPENPPFFHPVCSHPTAFREKQNPLKSYMFVLFNQ